MSDPWTDFEEPLGERVKRVLTGMATAYEKARDRSKQTAEHIEGPSGIGDPCARCLGRRFLGRPVTRTYDDPWCRLIGIAVHKMLQEAAEQANETALAVGMTAPFLTEHRVRPDDDLMPKGGELDLYIAPLRTVVDHKIVGRDRLMKYKHNGPGLRYRRQAHLYGWGLICSGADVHVENVAVAFWQRGGRLSDLYVWTEPLSEDIVEEALQRAEAIRKLTRDLGPQALLLLPADPDCWDCGGRDVTPEELIP